METQEKKIAQLEHKLKESIQAEEFFNLGSGKLITELLTTEITKLNADIISEKFLKDHVGYVNTLAELRAAKKLLDRLHALANPRTRNNIAARLEELQDGSE